MFIFAHVIDKKVVNTIVADSLENAEGATGAGLAILVPDDISVGIGWTYDGTTFIAPQ